jgi:hypothetical protein
MTRGLSARRGGFEVRRGVLKHGLKGREIGDGSEKGTPQALRSRQ